MKEAAETYLGVTNFNQNTKILPSIRNNTEGMASTKRNNIGVESAAIGYMKHYDFCCSQGHNKVTYPTVKLKGKQLTPSCSDLIMSVPPTSDAIGHENIDPVVLSDSMGLQVVQLFVIGDETYLNANFLLVIDGIYPFSVTTK